MAFLGVGPGVELHYYDDDFTDPWRSAPTMLCSMGSPGAASSGTTGCHCCPVNSASCVPT